MSTIRADPGLDASNTAPCVSKNDCSTDAYSATRVRVISHSPPNVGALMSSATAPNMETPPLAPQYHESAKERSFWGAACAAAMAGSRADHASPAVNVRIDRIAQPQMTRGEVSAADVARSAGDHSARTVRSARHANSCQRRELRRSRHVIETVMYDTRGSLSYDTQQSLGMLDHFIAAAIFSLGSP